jgi:hypothetical protein
MTSLDLARVQAEINEEVKRRRAAGDFPPGLERELDAVFARYAPAGASDDFDEVISQAETQSFIHADVPTLSNVRGVSQVKRVLRKVMAWYMRFITTQITAFAGAITRAVKLLGARVDNLETITVRAGERTLNEVQDRRSGPDLTPWTKVVLDAVGRSQGRVLHAECGAGGLLGALIAAGADAYGVEPAEGLAVQASRAGLDVRADDALVHLRALPEAALSGLVLSGCVDALPLGQVLELADRATTVVAPGGTVVVLSSGVPLDPVVADLAPGRPLHPETWCHLLADRGLADTAVHHGADDGARLPADAPNADIINRALDRLLTGPYAVVARKR